MNKTGRKPSQVCEMAKVFGANVRRVRKQKGMGLRETSRQLGIGENHLSRIETAKLNPNLDTVERIRDLLGREVLDNL